MRKARMHKHISQIRLLAILEVSGTVDALKSDNLAVKAVGEFSEMLVKCVAEDQPKNPPFVVLNVPVQLSPSLSVTLIMVRPIREE